MKNKVETTKAPKATGQFSQAVVSGKLVYKADYIGLVDQRKGI